MTKKIEKFVSPTRESNFEGKPRHVGYELEFAGLSFPEVGDIVATALDGSLHRDNHAESRVDVPKLGEFVIELDWKLGKDVARDRAAQHNAEAKEWSDDKLMEWVTDIARQVVPVEIVAPPIAWNKLHLLNGIIKPLRKAGAVGTEDSFLYAFGVHINTELPSLDASTIHGYLKAYGIAQDWLTKAHEIDISRRITPYIDPYPKAYIRELLQQNEAPELPDIIDHYLLHNATRNRGLDMLPLFKHLDEQRVVNAVGDARVNARPTFHYRLPNCDIDNPNWDLHDSWTIWCVVEALAADESLLSKLASRWLEFDDRIINLDSPPWHEPLNQLWQNLKSA